MSRIYTRTGDQGETGLLGPVRVPKFHLRVEVNGTLDEAGAAMALGRSMVRDFWVSQVVERVQREMFLLGAEVASAGGAAATSLTASHVQALERDIDHGTGRIPPMRRFIVPGMSTGAAALHLARTIIRRAERQAVKLARQEGLRPEILSYLNRLSDLLFVLARVEEHEAVIELVKQQVIQKLREGNAGGIWLNEAANATRVWGRQHVMVGEVSLEVAKKLLEAAEVKAEAIGVPVVVAVVDTGGNLVALHRMDGALLGSLDIAINKAFTAAAFKMETGRLSTLAAPGSPLFGINTTNGGRVVTFGGGFPLAGEGRVFGGIGVSGGTVDEDEIVGRSALEVWERITRGLLGN
ncbi:hypothetical protein SY88_08605 [Clostridiales bacterium PH28_bin88]|nr:hypothetical protein SY88_08605 [Clostridiales bacterium PH28_bin88]